MIGTIFDIKEMTLHDGPGIRVTVFFKGCPLSCIWCHNPEGLKIDPEPMIGESQREVGYLIEAKKLASQLKKYKKFLEISEGGITLSGGEPLMQPDFAVELIKNLEGIHITLQTSGYTTANVFKKVIELVDYVIMDIKLADTNLHKKYTGVTNERILENFQILKSSGIPYVIRIPLIPNITDTKENLRAISEIVLDSPVELLPFNRLAGAKYSMVGRKFEIKELKNNEVDETIFKNVIKMENIL